MGILTGATNGAAIPDVYVGGRESMGQIQKFAIQRIFSTGTTKNKFVVATANPNVLASWTAKTTATDGTKIVQSPYVSAPVTEPGAARTYGGGNDTVGGVEIIVGREQTSFNANILEAEQRTIADLKKYQNENAGVFLFDEHQQMLMLADNPETPTELYPIPINAFFVGDKGLGGLEAPDLNALMWKFNPNWSDKVVVIKATDFNPLDVFATS